MTGKQHQATATLHHDNGRDESMTLANRDAWALYELIRCDKTGCTPIDNPGPRWSAYVLKLRKAGFVIETIHEGHKGMFAGRHARYVLRSTATLAGDLVRELSNGRLTSITNREQKVAA